MVTCVEVFTERGCFFFFCRPPFFLRFFDICLGFFFFWHRFAESCTCFLLLEPYCDGFDLPQMLLTMDLQDLWSVIKTHLLFSKFELDILFDLGDLLNTDQEVKVYPII